LKRLTLTRGHEENNCLQGRACPSGIETNSYPSSVRQLATKLKGGPAWEEHDLVFCNIYGRFLNSASLYKLFATLVKKAGLPHMRFHDPRHSAATILLAMKVPVKVVQELLGHSSITVTLNVYSHVLPSMQEEAMDRMEHLFGKDEHDQGESGQR